MDFRLEPAALYAQVVNDFGKSDNRLEIEPTYNEQCSSTRSSYTIFY
jgi:hypothetical protein